MSDITELTKKVIRFRDERDWKQFHKPKDIAISLALEAAEVLEHFQWKTDAELEEYIKKYKEEIGDELSDVLYWILTMSHELHIDMVKAFNDKMIKNEKKYPIEKSKGNHRKYNQYA